MMGFCYCSVLCCALLFIHSSFVIILMEMRYLATLLSWVFLASRDCCVAIPRGAMGLSAVCDCGIF